MKKRFRRIDRMFLVLFSIVRLVSPFVAALGFSITYLVASTSDFEAVIHESIHPESWYFKWGIIGVLITAIGVLGFFSAKYLYQRVHRYLVYKYTWLRRN